MPNTQLGTERHLMWVEIPVLISLRDIWRVSRILIIAVHFCLPISPVKLGMAMSRAEGWKSKLLLTGCWTEPGHWQVFEILFFLFGKGLDQVISRVSLISDIATHFYVVTIKAQRLNSHFLPGARVDFLSCPITGHPDCHCLYVLILIYKFLVSFRLCLLFHHHLHFTQEVK